MQNEAALAILSRTLDAPVEANAAPEHRKLLRLNIRISPATGACGNSAPLPL
jgi:hypothetical protein